MRHYWTIVATALLSGTPLAAQTTPAIPGDAVAGSPAVLPATSTAANRQVKQQVTVQLCLSGGNYVVCPAGTSGPQPSASSQSVTPASDATFPVAPCGPATDSLPGATAAGTRPPLWCTTSGTLVSSIYNPANAAATVMRGDGNGVWVQLRDASGPILSRAPNTATVPGSTLALPALNFNHLWNGTDWVRQAGDGNGAFTQPKGSANLSTGQVSVGTTATQIVAARTARSRLTITQAAAGPCYYGPTSAVSATTGARLAVAGASKTYQYAGALFGVCPGGAVTTDTDEEF